MVNFNFSETDTYTFDIEADALYNEASVIHCIVLKNYNTKEVHKYGPDKIEEALTRLSKAGFLIGHNIIDYDIRVIKKLYPKWETEAYLIDTLVYSKLVYTNRMARDIEAVARGQIKKEEFQIWDKTNNKFVSAIGSQSLEAWGLRLGVKKDEYHRYADWKVYEPRMLEYCAQDVEVNEALFLLLESKKYPRLPLEDELEAQRIMTDMMEFGWPFDRKAAEPLYAMLLGKKNEIKQKLQTEFTGWWTEMKTPEYYSAEIDGENFVAKSKGELSDLLWLRFKGTYKRKDLIAKIIAGPNRKVHTPFNPGSAWHIYKALNAKYGWICTEWTDEEKPKPKCSTEVLERLEYPEAKMLVEYETVQDRIEKIAEGKDGGYLTQERNGRIHGSINPLGAETHRATHRNPNIGQVPANDVPFGKQFRALFTAGGEGKKLLGSDASSQEIRILAHFMAEFDDGEYVREVIDGDVHTKNQRAMEAKTRADAKTAFYAFLYGSGDWKLGWTLGCDNEEVEAIIASATKDELKRAKYTCKWNEKPYDKLNIAFCIKGGRLKTKLLANIPALARVIENVKQESSETGCIVGLDGRLIYIKKPHAALNYLIQSSGAIITKKWIITVDEMLRERGLKKRYNMVGWIHDEIQGIVDEEYAEEIGKLKVEAMKRVEKFYNFRCPLGAEYKIGNNWSETH